MVIILILLLAWAITNAISNARLDHAYARQGMVSPRLEARYGAAAARARVAKYGIFDHLRDNWRDAWARRTEAVIAARNARAAGGGRVRFRDRARAARNAVDAPQEQVTPSPATTAPATTNPHPAPDQPGADPAPPPSDPPADPAGDAQPAARPGEPVDPDVDPAPTPGQPSGRVTFTATAAGDPQPDPDVNPAPTPGAGDSTTPGGTVTGEVVNYETALADIDARIDAVRDQIDAADAALASLASAKADIETLQTTYEPTAEAAATAMDSKAALNLDGTTMGHASAGVDAMPVGAVNNLYEAIEAIEAATEERRNQAVAALAALEAEREHLIATYSDANATVAGNLGGDSRFLDGAGGAPSSPAPQPAAAA